MQQIPIAYKPVIAHIDLTALKNNYRVVKQTAPHSKILAVVKSNAYGHGATTIAAALEPQADAFGVAWLDEAIKVRSSGIKKPLLLLKGFLTQSELETAAEYNLSTVIHNQHQLELLETTKLKNKINVWMKIDTGMHRLGFAPQDAEAAYARLSACAKVNKPLSLLTHLSDADDISNPKTDTQIACFKTITANLDGEKSIGNSGGTINWQTARADWVRIGILLYGVSPLMNKQGGDLGVHPVMTLTSKLLTVQHLKRGDRVGYGSTFECPEDMPVGIANIGYGDGYPRHAKSGTPILVNGVRCMTAGRVSMDMLAIDLRPCPNAPVGSEITLWGKGLPIEEVAQSAGSIAHELFCRLTQRVYFNYV